jgi:hypothetical protein
MIPQLGRCRERGERIVPSYLATLYRPREVWYDFVLACNGIRVAYRPMDKPDGLTRLAQALKAAGYADGPLAVSEIGVKPEHALHHSYPSIYTLADVKDSPVENEVTATTQAVNVVQMTDASFEALKAIVYDPDIWTKLGGRTRGFLRENGLVVIVDNRAFVSHSGLSSMDAHGSLQTDPRVEYAPFLRLLPMDESAWAKQVHHKTRGKLAKLGLTVIKDGKVSAT